MNALQEKLDAAVAAGSLLAASRENILALLSATDNPVYPAAVGELADAENWTELNDRFFRTLAFGTGGLRGRTIGRVVTTAEQGAGGPNGRPEHPCVGTNTMNFHNVSRAIQGMISTVKAFLAESGVQRRPRLVFGHDTRHFSRDFAEFCAKVCTDLGCDAWLFAAERSTPQLSFAIRHLGADAGVVLTASHNPPHDNGFKAYFNDGGQLVDPYATRVIEAVNAIHNPAYTAVPEEERGSLTIMGSEIDEAYITRLTGLVLEPNRLSEGPRPKIVFTTLHGTGGRIIPGVLRRLGCEVATVAAQDSPDGRFPTVASPNPENAEALQLAIEQAGATGADLVIGTDPDCDRMGVAARDADGKLVLITGNQIGSLLAYHRTRTLFQQGVLNDGNRERATLIKTFVTTDLQSAIAAHYGIGCVNTLTGFKYIAEKLRKYEAAIPRHLYRDYTSLDEKESRALRLEHSRYFIFGGEESYGYLGSDSIRDKDANGAAVMFVEMACYAISIGLTVPGLLDLVYREFGYFLEKNHSKTFEGAEGAARIAALAASYAAEPPTEVDGSRVGKIRDFNRDTLRDEEGDGIPREKMLFVELEDGRSFAVRPSGTEPKIKYYLFGRQLPPSGGTLDAGSLAAAKAAVGGSLASLWDWLEADITRRLA
jgi:phosphoglucomutase